MSDMFFDGWASLVRTLAVGLLSYLALVAFLRLAGKRILSKMNAFDFVVTVALGSTLATILLSKDVSLAQGAVALMLLIGLQFAATWTSVRVRRVRSVLTGEPTLLLHRGSFLAAAMREARVTEDEVRAAVRGAGLGDLGGVEAVVLETDGSFSVVRGGAPGSSSLADVRGHSGPGAGAA